MVDILAIGAHPDDIEFGAGGALARMAGEGKSMVWVDLTLGEKGTNGTPEERRKEGLEAAAIVGAERVYLDFPDCGIMDTYEGRLELVKVMRHYKPTLVLAPVWKGEMNHPDHLATGVMARYAFRFSRFSKILPDLPTHLPKGILHYLYPHPGIIDFLLDVSPYVDVWRKMMLCHRSQHKTYDFTDRVLSMAASLGVYINKPYAQGFVKGNPVEVQDLLTVCQATKEV